MNVVAWCPLLTICHVLVPKVVVGKQSQSCSTTVGTKLTATGIFGDLLNSESGPPRPGASLSDNNHVVIPLTYIQSNW